MTSLNPTAPKVFISYARADAAIARQLWDRLRVRGIEVGTLEDDRSADQPWLVTLRDVVATSDYVIVLLSHNSVRSASLYFELGYLYGELTARGVTLLPVRVDDCQPPEVLARFQVRDLFTGPSGSEIDPDRLQALADAIRVAPAIDFDRLDPRRFENLVRDLLVLQGFEVRPGIDVPSGDPAPGRSEVGTPERWSERMHAPDLVAAITVSDPLGGERRLIYAVEVKRYRFARPDLHSLQLLSSIVQNYRRTVLDPVAGLMVTDSQLTSAAKEWIEDESRRGRADLRVLDGPALKRLVLAHPQLARDYFPPTAQQSGDPTPER